MIKKTVIEAANWVHERCDGAGQLDEISEALQALDDLRCGSGAHSAPVMVPDLLPGLEVLFLPRSSQAEVFERSGAEISLNGLVAIARALTHEMRARQNDMFLYESDEGDQVFVYLPEARSTVLAASGVALIDSENQ